MSRRALTGPIRFFSPQVYEDLRALTLSLDDVAEFTGALDEDLDDVGY